MASSTNVNNNASVGTDAHANAVPIGIFTTYMATATALTALCIHVILSGPVRNKGSGSTATAAGVKLFSVLAVASLATTWFYMFCYFQWSYRDWAATTVARGGVSTGDDPRLGDWLHDTSLFHQAWVIVLDTPERIWWAVQIFGFCAVWSVVLSVQGTNRGIPHLWAFMLLGQIVALSFASNLSFAAILMYRDHDHDAESNSNSKNGQPRRRRRVMDQLLLLANLVLTLLLLANSEASWFMYLLLAPHVLAFVPLVRDRIFPSKGQVAGPSMAEQFGLMSVLVAVATKRVWDHGGDWAGIAMTFYEHPAVRSVGWDVICCWVSYAAWAFLGV